VIMKQIYCSSENVKSQIWFGSSCFDIDLQPHKD
jgi:hypothetical protein